MPSRRLVSLGMSLLTALAAVGCAVPHDYRDRLFSASMSEMGVVEGGSEKPLEVTVRFPAGGTQIRSTDEGVYKASVNYCEVHAMPSALLVPAGGDSPARLTLALEGKPGVFAGFGGERNRMDLALTSRVALILDLDLGEGESVIDVSELRFRRFNLHAGAGDTRVVFGGPNPERASEVTIQAPIGDLSVDRLGSANAERTTVMGGIGSLEIDLSGPWRTDGAVLIEASVGSLYLRLPRGPGIRLEVGSPWSEDLDLAGFTREGQVWRTDGFATASPRLDIRVEAGIGSITVESVGS